MKFTASIEHEAAKSTEPLYITSESGSAGRPKGTTPITCSCYLRSKSSSTSMHQITLCIRSQWYLTYRWSKYSPAPCRRHYVIRYNGSPTGCLPPGNILANAGAKFTCCKPTKFALVLEVEPEIFQACCKLKIAWFCSEAFRRKCLNLVMSYVYLVHSTTHTVPAKQLSKPQSTV